MIYNHIEYTAMHFSLLFHFVERKTRICKQPVFQIFCYTFVAKIYRI